MRSRYEGECPVDDVPSALSPWMFTPLAARNPRQVLMFSIWGRGERREEGMVLCQRR